MPRALMMVGCIAAAGSGYGQPTRSPYDTAVAAIARRQANDDSVAVSAGRSILLTHGASRPRAIVLLHGLTDSPRQFESLAYLLYVEGNNVYVPRLPQHGLRGGTVRSLSALTGGQLQTASDSIVDEARGLGDSVIVVGLSMGATMTAWIVQQHAIARAVLVAPAVEIGRVPSLLQRPLIGLMDRLPSITARRSPLDSTRPDREVGFNSRASAEIFELGSRIASMASRAPPRTHDVVLLLNAADRTVSSSAAQELVSDWARWGADVSVYRLPDSMKLPHNIIDPLHGRAGGDEVLWLLRDLAYGLAP